MRLYSSTKQIPGLEDKPLSERLQLLEEAGKQMTVPEKTMLNILKLLVLVPVFVLVLRVSSDWTALVWAAMILLLYPIFVKPVQYSISAKYLKK